MNPGVGPKTNSIENEMNPGRRAQDQLNTNEPTAPYVKAQESNLGTCWVIGESNLGPFASEAASNEFCMESCAQELEEFQ